MDVEIYGLFDPNTNELRYVGKANNSEQRLKTHIRERDSGRPVNNWIKSLVESGMVPVLRVLETVPAAEWEFAERRLIAMYRKTCDLLNLADGGAIPSQTTEQRKKAAKASLRAQASKHPAEIAVAKANFELSRLHARFMKDGAKTGKYFHAYATRFMMRCYYAVDPSRHTAWANL